MADVKMEAIDFMGSVRGQYIMGQVLTYGIRAMEAVPEPHRETSNIADARFILDNVFAWAKVLTEAQREFQKGD
jgi:hypothetical protein